jgi:hypothetical protein
MSDGDASGMCPPHHWEVTSIRIDGVSYYHHCCKKCNAEKDVVFSASGATRWISRKPQAK